LPPVREGRDQGDGRGVEAGLGPMMLLLQEPSRSVVPALAKQEEAREEEGDDEDEAADE